MCCCACSLEVIALTPASAAPCLASSNADGSGGQSQGQLPAASPDPASTAVRAHNLRELQGMLGSVSGSYREVGSAAGAACLFGLKETAPAASNVTLTIGSAVRIEVRQAKRRTCPAALRPQRRCKDNMRGLHACACVRARSCACGVEAVCSCCSRTRLLSSLLLPRNAGAGVQEDS